MRDVAPIRSTNELLELLDELLESGDRTWWDGLFADRTRPCPFFVDGPDETMVEDFRQGSLRPGRVLELGCGNGRNAIYLASLGCAVEAVDFSEAAIRWAEERARAAGRSVRFLHRSIFELDFAPAAYDIVYDSGCFHHVAPHRREAYLELVASALKPSGVLSLVCFGPEGGSGLTDLQVYERRTLGGGLGYSEADVRRIFEPSFELVEFRGMREMRPQDRTFGKDFLRAARMVRLRASR